MTATVDLINEPDDENISYPQTPDVPEDEVIEPGYYKEA